MTVLTVFTSFLAKVLVDALSHELERAEFLESWVIQLLSRGQGAEYIYQHMAILPVSVLISALVTVAISYFRFSLRANASSRINKQMQLVLFRHLEKLPFSVFKTEKSGDLIQTCTRDVDVLRQF